MLTATRIVIQARVASQRLPGKALLPIAHQPMAVLAARRAARGGMSVTVATSAADSDDLLARTCDEAELPVYRGSGDDVYSRFLGAAADLGDDSILVRLTADNVFPDADLLAGLIERLWRSGTLYVAPRWPADGLPYGVAAEVFYLGALRRHRPASQADAEHVTPALERAVRNPGFPTGLGFAHLRATVDTLDDYCRVGRVFADVPNPCAIGWRELCGRLAELPDAPRRAFPLREVNGAPHSQLTLGTAQLGMPYGIANIRGMPSAGEATRIVHRAIDHGVTHIDTARVYGESEARLGAALSGGHRHRVKLITKLAPIDADSPAPARHACEASVFASCRALRTDHIDVLLLHRAKDLRIADGAVWHHLLKLKEDGAIGALGASVQTAAEADAAADPAVEAMQLPFNLLDRRWHGCLAMRNDITLYTRSVFLQGLLADAPSTRWPSIPGVDATALLAKLKALAIQLDRKSIKDLAVAFVRAHPRIDSAVIGMETEAQLEDNLSLFAAPPLEEGALSLLRERLPALPDSLLNPARWP